MNAAVAAAFGKTSEESNTAAVEVIEDLRVVVAAPRAEAKGQMLIIYMCDLRAYCQLELGQVGQASD